jgi:hypothetical protein
MENPFRDWLIAQYKPETQSFGNIPPRIGEAGGPERADFFRWNCYAATDELHEAGQEIAWKPWASSDHFNRQAYLKELVDALFFVGNLVLLAGEDGDHISYIEQLADELWDLYQQKVEVNVARMESGTYDGVTSKCPICHREMDVHSLMVDSQVEPVKQLPHCPEHGYIQPVNAR